MFRKMEGVGWGEYYAEPGRSFKMREHCITSESIEEREINDAGEENYWKDVLVDKAGHSTGNNGKRLDG